MGRRRNDGNHQNRQRRTDARRHQQLHGKYHDHHGYIESHGFHCQLRCHGEWRHPGKRCHGNGREKRDREFRCDFRGRRCGVCRSGKRRQQPQLQFRFHLRLGSEHGQQHLRHGGCFRDIGHHHRSRIQCRQQHAFYGFVLEYITHVVEYLRQRGDRQFPRQQFPVFGIGYGTCGGGVFHRQWLVAHLDRRSRADQCPSRAVARCRAAASEEKGGIMLHIELKF